MHEAAPWLWLYRPEAPSARAQAIQVVHMAHAMARRGHPTTLCVEPAPGHRPDAHRILAWYGLEPVETLRLVVLPAARTPASIAFRARVGAWALRHGRRGIVYARSKRYARTLLRWAPGIRVVLEAHEVDSRQAEERGEDPAPWRALEREVLEGCLGVVANAPGTLRLLRRTHRLPPALVAPNATHAARFRAPAEAGRGVGYVGSVRSYKGLDTLAEAARRVDLPVTLVGADPEAPSTRALVDRSGGRLRVEAPIPHAAVPDRLVRFRVLVATASDGLFGRQLTSPLKLQDYLASGVPVVAADTAALRAVAGQGACYYRPGDPESLAAALEQAAADPGLRARLVGAARPRTWDQRAGEIARFVGGLA